MREKLVRFRGNHSQAEIARKYSVSQQAWSKWERGVAFPSPSMMLTLERDSGIPLKELFFENNNNLTELKGKEQAHA